MDLKEFERYSNSLNERDCILEPYRGFIVERLGLFQDTPAAQMHDWLKEHHPSFPGVTPKTVYNFVMKIRQEHNLPKLKVNEREIIGNPLNRLMLLMTEPVNSVVHNVTVE